MKMKKSMVVLISFLSLAPLLLVAAVYSRLPDTIPMQWGFNGQVRYDPKINIWFMASLSPLLALLFPFMAKIDPRKRNYEKFGGAYQAFMAIMLLFLLMMNGIVISESFYPGRISVYHVVMLGVGLLFVYMGNIMPKVKSNFYIGMRTPWTLSDTDVWYKTNRLSGYMFFVSGLILCLMPFILPEKAAFIALLAIASVNVIVPTVMSYIWYRKNHPDDEE